MGKSQETYSKKEREKKRQKKKQEKQEKRELRKQSLAENKKKTFEEMLSYVDENGNLTSTPPDPSKKHHIKAEDIILGIPPKDKVASDPIRKGYVKFFNDDKGFGFIVDDETKETVFVHINNLSEPLQENDKVTFEVEKGPKGLAAVRVNML